MRWSPSKRQHEWPHPPHPQRSTVRPGGKLYNLKFASGCAHNRFRITISEVQKDQDYKKGLQDCNDMNGTYRAASSLSHRPSLQLPKASFLKSLTTSFLIQFFFLSILQVTVKTRPDGMCPQSWLCRSLRKHTHLRSGASDQPRQHRKTLT